MDTGGLSRMSYNNYQQNAGLAVPNSGYGSRTGKGGHIKRLSVAPPATINSIYEEEADQTTNGRVSRASLLSGLRTAERQQSGNLSAPHTQTHHRMSSDMSGYSSRLAPRASQNVPQTAIGNQFTGMHNVNPYAQMIAQQQQQQFMPEQVLAPQFGQYEAGYGNQEQMDPAMYQELLSTNMFLLQRQQQLQQQLASVTAAANQLQGMNLNGPQAQQTQINPQMSLYAQQLQNGMQPVVTPVPGQPGVYTVYNPMTGQQSYVVDQSGQSNQLSSSPPYGAEYTEETYERNSSPALIKTSTVTPPKKTPSPPSASVTPLPAPSSNAFRPGHRKSSSIGGFGAARNFEGSISRNAALKSVGAATAQQTGTFGPGMARAGEHPTRQPRGPPPMEELLAAPTTRHEGSKNFAARQRRRALNSLMQASKERRSGKTSNGAGTPSSESELTFSMPTPASDADSDSMAGTPDISGKPSPSLHQLRGSVTGAIGSEWKELRERSRSRGPTPVSSNSRSIYSAGSGYGGRNSAGPGQIRDDSGSRSVSRSGSRIGWQISSFDDDAAASTGVEVNGSAVYGLANGGGYAGVVANGGMSMNTGVALERKGTPKLVLTSAERRKNSIFQ